MMILDLEQGLKIIVKPKLNDNVCINRFHGSWTKFFKTKKYETNGVRLY